MKNIIKLTLVLILLIHTDFIFGQTTPIGFTILSESVAFSDQQMETTSTITKTGESLTWTQINNGFSETTNFTVTGHSGNWHQSTSQGLITYTMVTENDPCELTLSGQGNNLSATLTYTLSGGEQEQYIFDINAIIYQ